MELLGLGLGGAGHARELLVQAEVILNGDGGEGLGLALDGDRFLGLDGLVESIAPAAAGHFAAGMFVDDDDLVVLHDVMDIALVEAVGLEQLGDGVDGLGAFLEDGLELGLLLHALASVGIPGGVDLMIERGQIRQHEGVGILGRNERAPLFGEVGLMRFLLDGEEHLLLLGVEFLLGRIGMEEAFGLEDELLVAGFLEDAEEALGPGLTEFDAVEEGADLGFEFLGVLGVRTILGAQLFEEHFGLAEESGAEFALGLDQLFDHGAELAEFLVDGDHGGAGDDERGAGLVDEDGVHFVDDGEEVSALDLFLLARGHAVVAEIIESELGIGAVGDVARVHLAADLGGLIVQDAADGQAEEPVNGAHPLGIACGKVIVDGDDMNAAAGDGVEKDGEGSDQGLAFAGAHFSDLAAVKGDATDQLYVEGNHVPAKLVPADIDILAAQTAAGVLDRGKGHGQEIFEERVG